MTSQQIKSRIAELQAEIDKLKKETDETKWTLFEIEGKKYEISDNLGEMNWQDAMDKCKELGGFLPPRWMLCFIYDELKALAGSFESSYYWSSTEGSVADAWGVDFSDGGSDSGDKAYAGYVRCVRGRD